MLEGMTTLGFMAAHTTRARLGLMVGGVHYRDPGLWVKADDDPRRPVAAGAPGSGIGAAWNEEESRGLGFAFPPLGERFELLEDTLRMAHGMWQGERGTEAAFDGRQYRATRLLNSPQSISRPRVPIMVGGGGEKKTLRLVAQYADACNVFGSPGGDRPQVRDPRRALRGRRPRPRRDRALDAPERPPRARPAAARTETPGPGRRPASASSPTPAPSTSSSSSRTSPSPARWRRVGRDVLPALHALPD